MLTINPQNEYWFHVAPQHEIPIAGEVEELINSESLIDLIENFDGVDNIEYEHLAEVIEENPNNIDILRSLVGVSDKRMYLELSYIFYKTKFNDDDEKNILGTTLYEVNRHPLNYFKRRISGVNEKLAEKSLDIITNYLIEKGILNVLNSLKTIGTNQAHVLINRLVNVKEAQQKLTKRRGHGMEQLFAQVLHELGVLFLPKNKHTNPMAQDPNVNRITFQVQAKTPNETWAFDIIVLSDDEPYVFTQGLIHTSDPGQFGVNKSDETVTIKAGLTNHNQENQTNKELWGLVDGIGFTENKPNTIDKMLNEFDCFVQLKTFYKTGLQLHHLGIIKIQAIRFDMNYYSETHATQMFEKYGSADIQAIYDETMPAGKEIKAGHAWLYIQE